MDRLDLLHGGGRRTRTWAVLSARRIARRDITAAVLLLILFASGCAQWHSTTRFAARPPGISYGERGYGPHVEIIRGLGGYMPGTGRLQQRLASCGMSSTVSYGFQSHQVAQRILQRRRAGDGSPIVLIGYATAGHGTMVVADDLASHGICVDKVILLEPSFFEPVRSNVRFCFVALKPEPLQQWNPVMRGLPVRVESAATCITFVNLEKIDPCNRLDRHNHLTITTDGWVQQLLVVQAAAAFHRGT